LRILFTFVGGHGHFEPLAPIATAAVAAGHSVAFGCAAPMAAVIENANFTSFSLGPLGNRAHHAPKRTGLRPVDRVREERDLRERFARVAARDRVPHIVALCADWQPDVLVCDETDFGAVIAAEHCGLPYATVLVIAAGGFVRADVVGEPLNELRGQWALPPDPALEMLRRYLVLAPFPRAYRDPGDPLPATAHPFFAHAPARNDGAAPPWASALPGAPTVYFTLGTIFNMESGDLMDRVLAGLRDLPINVIATTGAHIDPAELGTQPPHVHLARFLPQASVLPYCDAVVSHGGSGSVLGALAHGLPSVLVPIGADQPWNAARCVELGVAEVLDAETATPRDVAVAVGAVLQEPGYRRSAEQLRDEIRALPGLDTVIGLLERLATERRPLDCEHHDEPHE
jgi:UDP:flavonoid glycosyltransferase YjiC (YdhE family)